MDLEDPFSKVLSKAVNYPFNALVEQDESSRELEPDASPLTFYDRHIDSKLICRNLRDLSSLPSILSKLFDEAIAKFYNDGHKMPSAAAFVIYDDDDTTTLQDARSINVLYGLQPGHFARCLPSIFYFHPGGSVWDSVFCHSTDTATYEKKFTSECSLQVYYDHEETQSFEKLKSAISNETAKKLEDIRDRYPPLANWLFCAMTPAGKAILKQIQGSRPLRWEISRTLGFKNISFSTPPLDAEDGLLHRARILPRRPIRTKTVQRKGREPKDSKRDAHEKSSPVTQKRSPYVTVSRRPMKSVRHYSDSHQYIQHAWATATRQDSTFMVFSCGIYERIGVRHRESQTLYLSPLIETTSSRNPPYGKLHLGLHIAIVQDFLERYERDNSKSGNKRSADHLDDEDLPKGKRMKLPVPTLNDNEMKNLSSEMSKRELALVNLSYGPYCSPAPVSFFRLGSSCARDLYQPFEQTKNPKSKFSRTEYFELVLEEPLGEGAVGIVHPASLSLFRESGETLRHNIVVKLAFSTEQRTKLEHEFQMYTRLARAEEPVEGIVTVHGLFEDPESGCFALLMENGGQSLRALNKEQPDRDEHLQIEEREACMRALKTIHNANVRHRDLRPDNILISRDPSLKVFIIDFDCASSGGRTNKLANEIKRLEAIFDGEDVDFWHS